MLKKIILQNFQSHRYTEIELSTGVNIIVGSTDSGKSAIMRGLKWLRNNRPGGDSFRSYWGGDTIVTVETTEGNTISRFKTKTENGYFLNGKKFVAIGTDVPAEIVAALDIAESNTQFQFDRPFLLSSSDGDVASHFNSISNLEVIDKSQSAMRQWVQKIDIRLKASVENLESTEVDLQKYEHIDKLDIEVEVLETLCKKYTGISTRLKALEKIVVLAKEVDEEIHANSSILALEKQVHSVLHLQDVADALKNKINALESTFSDISRITPKIERQKKKIVLEEPVFLLLSKTNAENAVLKKIHTLELLIKEISETSLQIENTVSSFAYEGAVVSVIGLVEKVTITKSSIRSFESLLNAIQKNSDLLVEWKTEYLTAEKAYKDAAPDICPLCDSPIKIKHTHK